MKAQWAKYNATDSNLHNYTKNYKHNYIKNYSTSLQKPLWYLRIETLMFHMIFPPRESTRKEKFWFGLFHSDHFFRGQHFIFFP